MASASALGSVPSAASAASAYPASTDARLVAATQTSRSTSRDRQRDSAKNAASWVLPHDPSQSRDPAPPPRPGTSTTALPGTSAAPSRGALSGLVLNPSASGGTTPERTGHSAWPSGDPTGPSAGTWLINPLPLLCGRPGR